MKSLEKRGEVMYDPYIEKEDLRNKLVEQGTQIIFSNPCKQVFKIDKDLLEGTEVDTICTASTGTNHIDMEYCNNNNVDVLCIAKDYDILKTITATAEMSFTLMLSLIRDLPNAVKSASNYEWDYEKHMSRQLNSMHVGIVGYGRLGEIYARFCCPFFEDVLVSDPYKNVTEGYRQVQFDELLNQADVIALHVHLNKDTYHMINESSISRMNDGVYLINTSRGDIVDERAVIDAVRSGKIKGYATDVISDEYKNGVNDSELIKAMNEGLNIIITPHISGCTKESQKIAYLHAISKLELK